MTLAAPRALVVEDDRSWQQILSEILTDAGLAVDVVDSLAAAVEKLRSSSHRLAVVDLSLGGRDHHNRDGLRVLEAVRRHDPSCVTVLLTGFATVELAVSVLTEHGAFTCLRKETFKRARFRELVHQALASAPPLDPDASPSNAAPAIRPDEKTSGLALAVEDDAGWRDILAELLSDAGYKVRACSSFGEALGCLRRERYELAVVDLSLASSMAGQKQDMEGYRLLSSTQAGGIPTIVVSGVATPAEIERAYAEHGIFAYLEKQTFNRRAFLRAVEEARAAGRAAGELDNLTDREREVLELLAQGLTNKEIARALTITTNTVKRHLKSVFKKLEVHTRSAAAARAVSAGVPAEPPEADSEAPESK